MTRKKFIICLKVIMIAKSFISYDAMNKFQFLFFGRFRRLMRNVPVPKSIEMYHHQSEHIPPPEK